MKEEGIHICLDSNGGLWNEHVEKLLKLTDLVLLDIKEFNLPHHQKLTGRSNEQTLHTAAWLEEYLLKGIKENTPEQIEQAANLFKKYFKTVQIN